LRTGVAQAAPAGPNMKRAAMKAATHNRPPLLRVNPFTTRFA
jgi:hypothetical protein